MPQQVNNLDDSELIQLYQQRDDKEAIGVLFERYYHLVLGVGLKYLQNSEAAKDMSMRVFEKLIRELKNYKIEYFKAWLYRVAQNECLMEMRKNKKITINASEMQIVSVESDDKMHLLMEKESTLNKMEEELEHLPHEQRDCIKMFYLQKKSYSEICSLTGFTFMQVKSFIQNGKRNLKIKLTHNT